MEVFRVSHHNDNKNVSNVNNKNVISNGSWDHAIAEAKAQIADMKVRTARLKAAIKQFAENKRAEAQRSA
jgi:hypothetical protein